MPRLFPYPANFNLNLAQEAATLVLAAYDQYQAFVNHTAWTFPQGYDDLGQFKAKPAGLFPKAEPFGFVARNQTTQNIFVTFRGTQSLDDWLSNVTFPQKPFPAQGWGNVEDGFLDIYVQCAGVIQSGVGGAGHAYVIGHSLGGALATLAGADLASRGKSVSMYNFASPRTGDPAFADKFNATITDSWRIANTEDIVTTVPLSTLVFSSAKLNTFHAILALASREGHSLNFEHVGVPINFTWFKGSIAENHSMLTYNAAIR